VRRSHYLPLAGVVSLAVILTGCTATLEAPSSPATTESAADFITSEPTIPEVEKALNDGEVTSAALVSAYLDRIQRFDDSGPQLNAIITVNDDALQQAEEMDEARAAGKAEGALFGIPVIVKDNMDTADLPTTAGSKLFEGRYPQRDSWIISQLKEAGAIILAKSNMDEFAYGQTTLSSMGGQTLNPYNLSLNPSGSSGGSSVAAAADFAPLTFGSDTGGSLRLPPATTNVVGIRPTTGLIGRTGVAPISSSLDTVGPIATSVTSIASALDVLAGSKDPDDPASLAGNRPESYVDALDADALKGARIGVLRELYGTSTASEGTNTVMAKVEDQLRSAGAELIEIDALGISLPQDNRNAIEMPEAFGKWLDEYGADRPADSLREVLDSGTVVPSVAEILESFYAAPGPDGGTASDEYRQTVTEPSTAYSQALQKYLADNDLDAFLYPTVKEAPAALGTSNWAASNSLMASFAGLPAISFPGGLDADGLPVGVEFMGTKFAEPEILSLAYAYQSEFDGRVQPESTR
jgi:Asp-tRNA(Asn)/Glu-tRNA(Gln) amidotransferase A subunit family amidase